MIEEEVLRTHADHATRAYDRVRPDYQRCATKVQQMMTAWLDDASINYESVSARAKTRSSFRRKSSRAHPKIRAGRSTETRSLRSPIWWAPG